MQYQQLDEKRSPVTLLLKGIPGTGKTFKAAHFPRPVFFNFDNNLAGLRRLPADVKKNIRIVDPRRDAAGKDLKKEDVWKNFVAQLGEVTQDASVKTIIIDSLTTLGEVLMDKIVGNGSPETKVQIQHWGDFQRYLKWLGEDLLCAKDLDKHVVFIAHEQMEKDELTQQVIYTLNLGGKLRTSYDLYFSDCWRCFTRTGSSVDFMVRTMPASNYNAKCSLTLPDQFKWEDQAANIQKQLNEIVK